MPRRKKITDDSEKQRILESNAGDVAAHHPAVQAVLSDDFAKATDLDGVEIALLLQQILQGQNSLLAKYDEHSQEIAKLKQMMSNTDERIKTEMTSQKKEIQEVLDRAEKLKLTGEAKDKLIAKASQEYTKEVQKARARNSLNLLKFHEAVAHMPTETVISPGQFIMTRQGQSIIPRLIPEEIRIKDMVWRLPPNTPVEVPKIVAERLREIRASQQETAKRKELLSEHMEQGKLAAEWSKVEGSKGDPLPIAH